MKIFFKLILISGLLVSHSTIAANLVCPNKYVYSGKTTSQAWPYSSCGNSSCADRFQGGYIDIHLISSGVTITSLKNNSMGACYLNGNTCDLLNLKTVGDGYWRLETNPNDKNYLHSLELPNYNLLVAEGYGPASSLQFSAELRQNTGAIIKTETISVGGTLQPTTSWNIADVVFDDLATNEEKSRIISGPQGNGIATLKKTKDSSYVTFKINGTIPSLNVTRSIPNNQNISLVATAGQTPGKGVATYTATLTCP